VRFRDVTHTDTLHFRISDVRSHRYDPALIGRRPRVRVLPAAIPRARRAQPSSARYTAPVRSRWTRAAPACPTWSRQRAASCPRPELSALRVFRAEPPGGRGRPGAGPPGTARAQGDDGVGVRGAAGAEPPPPRGLPRGLGSSARATRALDPLLRSGDIIRVDPVLAIRCGSRARSPGRSLVRLLSPAARSRIVRLCGRLLGAGASRSQVRVTRAVTGLAEYSARDVPGAGPGDLIWVPEAR